MINSALVNIKYFKTLDVIVKKKQKKKTNTNRNNTSSGNGWPSLCINEIYI